jgi:capsular polysaccharide transport system ATP-binding protein
MIVLDRVSKSYGTRGAGTKTILREVSAVIRPGDALGLLGRNGAGKSTLLKLLAGVEYPNAGRILRRMSVSWPLAHGVGLQGTLSGADNARFIARIYGEPVARVLDFVADFTELGAYLDMPVRTYSAGMTSRLLLGLSLAVEFDCYLVDEILGAGDARFMARTQQVLADRLHGRTIVMVSHIPEHLSTYCRTAAVLNGGALTFYEDVNEALATYQAL